MARASIPFRAARIQPVPEVFRVLRVQCGVGQRGRSAAGEDHVTMEVAHFGKRRELVSDKAREPAWIVVALGASYRVAPRGRARRQARELRQPLATRETVGKAREGSEHSVALGGKQLACVRDFRILGAWRVDRGQHAQVFGVIGDRQKIERTRGQTQLESHRMPDRRAFRVAVGVVRCRANIEDVRVERIARVQMKIAEVHVAQGIRGGPVR